MDPEMHSNTNIISQRQDLIQQMVDMRQRSDATMQSTQLPSYAQPYDKKIGGSPLRQKSP